MTYVEFAENMHLSIGRSAWRRGSLDAGRRVLFVGNSFEYFVSHRLALAEAARNQGWSVHVASPASLRGAGLQSHGITHHLLTLDRKGINPLRELQSLLRILAIYREVRPDLVHLIGPKSVMYGGLLARWQSIPAVVCLIPGMGYIYLLGGLKGRIVRALGHAGYRLGLLHPNKRVIFQNPEDRQLFLDRHLCSISEATLILGSGVDPQNWPAVNESAGKPIALFASRFLKEKGVEIFADVARQLLREGIDARFALVGEVDSGNPSSVSEEKITAWERDGIENWGFRQDMPQAFASCHLVCLPSYRREGIPRVLIEAASCGRPIVTFDVPGCREVVQNDVSGLLIPARDVNAYKSAVRRLLEDADLRQKMGLAGRRRVEDMFSLERIIRQTLDLYNQICPENLEP
jgi:glycosyltransferase involved in cell wall biosynthesis